MGLKEFAKDLDQGGKNRLRVRIKTEKGRVVDLTVQYETLINGKWRAVVRYDCSHGFAHRDILHPMGKKDKFPLKLNTLEQVLQYAEQDIKDRWSWYRHKYKWEVK